MRNLTHRCTQKGTFFQNQGTLFLFSKKDWGDPTLLPPLVARLTYNKKHSPNKVYRQYKHWRKLQISYKRTNIYYYEYYKWKKRYYTILRMDKRKDSRVLRVEKRVLRVEKQVLQWINERVL